MYINSRGGSGFAGEAGCRLLEPTLAGYTFPDPRQARFFEDIPGKLAKCGNRSRVFLFGFSLYERTWTWHVWCRGTGGGSVV